ncbi:MAG: proline--tRNA ligase [Nanoarchaeota archaeon]
MSVKKAENLAEWYPEVVLKAQMADYSPVKGCMVIRPNGYSIWEAMQRYFNERLRELKVENAYFPLFIPESFFKKEAEHAEGFSPEVAWIANKDEGERLAVRPTSETIMYDMYGKWVRSYRDLPLRINQWANVVRWETKATKLFLRTREFLWQEGHCVYETKEQCDDEVKKIIMEYKALAEGLLALPVIVGKKTKHETFAGAEYSLTIETFMPDGKALQSGTSHNLGQGFARAFGINFLGRDGQSHVPWQSSWGFSTRLIGALIMTHGDDKGVVIPPKVAQTQVVIVPILFDKTKDVVLAECRALTDALKKDGIRVMLDDRDDHSSGWKFNDWELKGVPLRLELGPKDLEKKQVMLVHRHSGKKHAVSLDNVADVVHNELEQIQQEMLAKARTFLDASIVQVTTKEEFLDALEQKKLVLAPFCCESTVEEELKEATGGVTSRCIPLDAPEPKGMTCVWSGKPAKAMVYFAKAY